jgi:serine/threonine-protein kinase HipA
MSWNGFVFAYLPGQREAVPAGRLSLLEAGTESLGSTFGFGTRYLQRANRIPLDPISLPINAAAGSERLYEPPARLRLFGAVRDAAPDQWGRRVIEAKLAVSANALPESEYLLNAGDHRFGALDFRESATAPPSTGLLPTATDVRYLVEAADRIVAGEPVPEALRLIFDAGTLGGARPKALVQRGARTYLAKFPRQDDGYDVPVIERACLELARQCGLEVPLTELLRLPDGRSVMLIERFDRAAIPGGAEARRHAVSALTVLGKHEQDSPASSYSELSQALGDFGVDGFVAQDRAELFGRAAFNVLISNNDDHLRNHAFIWDAVGAGWRLSPLYDVVPHPQVALERFLHLSLGPQGRVATLSNLLESHGQFGLLRSNALAVIGRVSGVVREWRSRFEALDVSPKQCDRVASAFRHPRDVGFT